MYPRFRSLILHWLKVPPEPHAPAGDPASLRVFRAGKHDLSLRLLGWAGPQVLALAGILFWTVMLVQVEDAVRAQRCVVFVGTRASFEAAELAEAAYPDAKTLAKDLGWKKPKVIPGQKPKPSIPSVEEGAAARARPSGNRNIMAFPLLALTASISSRRRAGAPVRSMRTAGRSAR